MSYPSLCTACYLGDHDKHDGKHRGLPGLIGGTYCPCPGDCKPPPLACPLCRQIVGHAGTCLENLYSEQAET